MERLSDQTRGSREIEDVSGWATCRYSLKEIDRAGIVLARTDASAEELELAERIVDKWRRAHSFPLNTFSVTLRKRAHDVDPKAIVAQRLKRMQSIRFKLRSNPKLRDRLSIMQDIGGCRAIVSNAEQLRELVDEYRLGCGMHKFVREDDYVNAPKKSGYRGIHRIYSYRATKRSHRGRCIEIQLRTKAQHVWATAVETASTYTGLPLKSNQGDMEWRRFFSLMASVIAIDEGLPTVPGTPTTLSQLGPEIAFFENQLGVMSKLHAARIAAQHIEEHGAGTKIFVLELDTNLRRLSVQRFKEEAHAARHLAAAEQRLATNPHLDVVQVKVESVKELKKAYPNYFADTQDFIRIVRDVSNEYRHTVPAELLRG